MKYFFILGTNPTLSIAELSAVFGLNKKNNSDLFTITENSLILETDKEINADQIIKKLGGVIKIGEIKAESKRENKEKILDSIKTIIKIKPKGGKFRFGISYYGRNRFNIKSIAMNLKIFLKEQKINCRWVTSRERVLSSVVVEQNKLTERGIEIVLIDNDEELFIGQTLVVQPFKELSHRDYGRPCRDDASGMLPPKLAQIMINLSGIKTDDIILDPFCGSGTILTEAMLMGYGNLIGSDISEEAIGDSEKNIEWIKENYELAHPPATSSTGEIGRGSVNYKLYNKDATEISKFIEKNSMNAIITEPYLGPQRGDFNSNKIKKELEALYSECLAEFRKILKPNGRVIIVFPIFVKSKLEYLSPNLNGFKIINPIPNNLRRNRIIKLTNRNTIIYGRQGQKIWREILMLAP